MYIHDFFQNFLKTFLVCFHGAFTSSVIAPDMPPNHEEAVGEVVLERRGLEDAGWGEGGSGAASSSGDGGVAEFEGEWVRS